MLVLHGSFYMVVTGWCPDWADVHILAQIMSIVYFYVFSMYFKLIWFTNWYSFVILSDRVPRLM